MDILNILLFYFHRFLGSYTTPIRLLFLTKIQLFAMKIYNFDLFTPIATPISIWLYFTKMVTPIYPLNTIREINFLSSLVVYVFKFKKGFLMYVQGVPSNHTLKEISKSLVLEIYFQLQINILHSCKNIFDSKNTIINLWITLIFANKITFNNKYTNNQYFNRYQIKILRFEPGISS